MQFDFVEIRGQDLKRRGKGIDSNTRRRMKSHIMKNVVRWRETLKSSDLPSETSTADERALENPALRKPKQYRSAFSGESKTTSQYPPSYARAANLSHPYVGSELVKPLYRAGIVAKITKTYWVASECDCTSIVQEHLEGTMDVPKLSEFARDATVLLAFGSAENDVRLVMEGCKRHVVAIHALQRQVSHAARVGAGDFPAMLVTIRALLSCELFSAVYAVPGNQGWVNHITGMNAIVRTAKSDLARMRFERFHLLHGRHLCLMGSLLTRRGMGLSSWNDLLDAQSGARNGVEKLIRLCGRLPVLLERSDSLTSSAKPSPAAVIRLMKTLASLEVEMQSLFEENLQFRFQCRNKVKRGQQRYSCSSRQQNTRTESTHSMTVEDMCTGLFLHTNCRALYWTCLFWIRQAILNVSSLVSNAEWPATQNRHSKDDMRALGERLLEVIAYYAAMPGGIYSKMAAARVPILVASQLFELTGDWEMQQRCCDMEEGFRRMAPFIEWDAVMPWSFEAVVLLLY